MAGGIIRLPVCIAGGGAITAVGSSLAGLSQIVRHNASGLRACPQLAQKGYLSDVAGQVPSSIFARMQLESPAYADAPAFLLAHGAIAEAKQNTRLSWDATDPQRRALVLSTTKGEITALERVFENGSCSDQARDLLTLHPLAAALAHAHAIQGPVGCVSTACVSGLLALQLGVQWVNSGAADLVMVVGVDLLSHFVLSGFTRLRALEPEGCRPFDKNRTGLSLGEGAGAMVLMSADRCAQAEFAITGWGSSNDANHLTGPSRDGSGLALAIQRALQTAHIAPESIEYINAHGTGTPFNDAMEALAIQTVFKGRIPPVSSAKGALGHTLGAAGILESLLCWVAASMNRLPGTPRLREPDAAVAGFVLADPRSVSSIQRMLKVNAGFGGTNAALVIERIRPTQSNP